MLYPLNKYLVVEPIEEEKTVSGVIIPEEASVDNSVFKLVRVLEPHDDSRLKRDMCVLVPTHMIEEANFFGKRYYLVTENNVMGIYIEEGT